MHTISYRSLRFAEPRHSSSSSPPIFSRLVIDPEAFVRYMRRPENAFARAVGRVRTLRETATVLDQRFLKGIATPRSFFPSPTVKPTLVIV
jgi:hypothetical protein